jgi:hypothetical protein
MTTETLLFIVGENKMPTCFDNVTFPVFRNYVLLILAWYWQRILSKIGVSFGGHFEVIS